MADPLTHLQLRHYRLVRAIADHGQLSQAAGRLALSQPAASRLLSEIERSLGAPLFERHPKGMRPTPTGEVMARRAAAILAEIDGTARELSAFRAGSAGSVRRSEERR